jgi:ATP-dependent Clp protease adaptor protein ClpS
LEDSPSFEGHRSNSMKARIPPHTIREIGAGSRSGGGGDNRTGTANITKTKPRTKRPNLYRVLLLNDDYTPMEFVVLVLERFFNKSREDATRIMLHVHQNGVGECGFSPTRWPRQRSHR